MGDGKLEGCKLDGGISRRGGASARFPEGNRSSEATGRSASGGRMPQKGAVSAADWG